MSIDFNFNFDYDGTSKTGTLDITAIGDGYVLQQDSFIVPEGYTYLPATGDNSGELEMFARLTSGKFDLVLGTDQESTVKATIDASVNGSVSKGVVSYSSLSVPNQAPVSNAGDDQTVIGGSIVSLDGTSSSDPENDTLSFNWTQTDGTTVILSGGTTAQPTFTAPLSSNVEFNLEISDGEYTSNDTVTIMVN